MNYAVIAVLASAVLIIINNEILFHRDPENESQAHHYYRVFLIAVLAYFATDVLWGIFRQFRLIQFQYIDTVAEFIAMALAIVCWIKYVIVYLEQDDIYGRILIYAGNWIFAFQLIMLTVNFMKPVFFWFDENGIYHPGVARYTSVMFQIVLFFLTAVYTLLRSSRTNDNAKRRRYNTIGSFGIVMVILLSMEMLFPIMPLYTAGYMLGICMMHTFVIEDELSDYIVNLEELLEREKQQTQQIISAQKLAHTDPLTGIKNKLAYIEKEKDLDARIENGEVSRMAIAVFDLNGLKEINDTKGHEVGDKYIVDGCKMICNHFKHSPVFRIGGDEFVAVLEGDDFKNRNRIMKAFNNLVMENSMNGGVVVSAGIAEYLPENDAGTKTIFDRADHYMYEQKRLLKLQDAG